MKLAAAIHVLAPGILGAGLAAGGVNEITQGAALIIAGAAGVAGGLGGVLVRKEPFNVLTAIARVLTSAMSSIALLAITLWLRNDEHLTLLPVVGFACLYGLFAWVLADKVGKALEGMSVKDTWAFIREVAKRVFGFGGGNAPGDNTP